MTTDREALLAAIAAHPDEDTPRLALAAWLDEKGDPARAEFIRLQVEVGASRRPIRDALDADFQYGYRREAAAALDRLDLLPKIAREFQLLLEHGDRWVPIKGAKPTYRGGFPISLEIPAQE